MRNTLPPLASNDLLGGVSRIVSHHGITIAEIITASATIVLRLAVIALGLPVLVLTKAWYRVMSAWRQAAAMQDTLR